MTDEKAFCCQISMIFCEFLMYVNVDYTLKLNFSNMSNNKMSNKRKQIFIQTTSIFVKMILYIAVSQPCENISKLLLI